MENGADHPPPDVVTREQPGGATYFERGCGWCVTRSHWGALHTTTHTPGACTHLPGTGVHQQPPRPGNPDPPPAELHPHRCHSLPSPCLLNSPGSLGRAKRQMGHCQGGAEHPLPVPGDFLHYAGCCCCFIPRHFQVCAPSRHCDGLGLC